MIIMSSKKMDDFDAYATYIAMKSHFQGDYDYVKYKGKVAVKKDSFYRRKDKKTFEELARKFNKKELEQFLLAAFLNVTDSGNLALARNEFMWTGNLLDEDTLSAYSVWRKRVQSLSYIFKNDVDKILASAIENELSFDEILKSVNGEYPLIMQLERRGDISLETLIVFENIFKFLDKVKIKETTYWPMYKMKCKKYASFLTINNEHYMDILRNIMLDEYYDTFGKKLERKNEDT